MIIAKNTGYYGILPELEEIHFRKKILQIESALKAADIQLKINLDTHKVPKGAIAVSHNGEITTPNVQDTNQYRVGQPAPEIKLRHVITMLNCIVSYPVHPLDLQYDGVKWTPMPVLSSGAKELVDACRGNMLDAEQLSDYLYNQVTKEQKFEGLQCFYQDYSRNENIENFQKYLEIAAMTILDYYHYSSSGLENGHHPLNSPIFGI